MMFNTIVLDVIYLLQALACCNYIQPSHEALPGLWFLTNSPLIWLFPPSQTESTPDPLYRLWFSPPKTHGAELRVASPDATLQPIANIKLIGMHFSAIDVC